MHKKQKLDESNYFLDLAGACDSSRPEFRFLVSAFLTSARSVLQYALEEAKTCKGGQAWFDKHSSAPEVKFMKDIRDENIHAAPVSPIRALAFGDSVSVSAQLVSITLTDADGTVHHGVVEQAQGIVADQDPTGKTEHGATVSYRFDGWEGAEDVVQLCARYFAAIEAIMSDGQTRRFLRREA